jgi:hypothetical protein
LRSNQQILKLVDRLVEFVTGSEDAHLVDHDLFHSPANIAGPLAAVASQQSVQPGLFPRMELAHQSGGDADFAILGLAEVGDELRDDHAGDHGFGHRVAAQAVEPVQVPACRLAAGEQALERSALAGVAGADAAHGIVLRGSHRNPVDGRIDAEKIMADILDFAQVLLDVRAAEHTDVQPKVIAVG